MTNNTLELHCPVSGDWTVAILNGKEIYSGHNHEGPLLWSLCAELNIAIENYEYSQEEYEEKFN